jgi:hypothetical protein
MLDGLAKVVGSSISHLADHESSDLRGRVFLASGLHPCVAVAVGDDLVWNVGDVLLDLGILEFTSDQSDISQGNPKVTHRFEAKMVFSPLTTACRRAGWPTKRSPSLVNATTDGVVRAPSAFSRTFGDPAS